MTHKPPAAQKKPKQKRGIVDAVRAPLPQGKLTRKAKKNFAGRKGGR